MIKTYYDIILCGSHFTVAPLFIFYIMVHICTTYIVVMTGRYVHQHRFTNERQTSTQIAAETTSQRVSVSPLSGAKSPSQSQNHPRAPRCRPLLYYTTHLWTTCQWQPPEKPWDNHPPFPGRNNNLKLRSKPEGLGFGAVQFQTYQSFVISNHLPSVSFTIRHGKWLTYRYLVISLLNTVILHGDQLVGTRG